MAVRIVQTVLVFLVLFSLLGSMISGIILSRSEVLPDILRSEIPKKGTYGDEFPQLQEYAQGDSYRYIHWKQSARTDILWVKDYRVPLVV